MKKLVLFFIAAVASISMNAQSYNWKNVPADPSVSFNKKDVPSIQLQKACPVREGCAGSYSAMTDQVAAFMSCMADKYDVILDAESITYDTWEIFQSGTVFCWGFLHHATLVLPFYAPIDSPDNGSKLK